MAVNFVENEAFNCNWKEAVYNGQPVPGLLVSDTGLMRRIDRYGNRGQVSCGTPNFNKANRNRLRQYMVSITPEKGKHKTVNLHRVIYETFTGDRFQPGDDIDHKDCNVANGHLDNLQRLSHRDNCRKKNIVPANLNGKCPIASQYRYQVCLQLNCRTLNDLPRAYFNEYHRLRSREHKGLPAIPKRINGGLRKAVA